LSRVVSAQEDSTWQQKPDFNISGFMDVFYVYDFDEPQPSQRVQFESGPRQVWETLGN
jgi:hypothetical protein